MPRSASILRSGSSISTGYPVRSLTSCTSSTNTSRAAAGACERRRACRPAAGDRLTDCVGDLAKRLEARQAVHQRLNGALFVGRAGTLERTQNFDAFDRIDAEVRLDVQIRIQHVYRIARAIAHEAEQVGRDVTGGCRRRSYRCARRRWSSRRNSSRCDGLDRDPNLLRHGCEHRRYLRCCNRIERGMERSRRCRPADMP